MNLKVIENKQGAKIGIDQESFEKLFHTYYDEVQHFIYYRTGDVEMAEDITQEAFLKLWTIREKVKLETVRSLLYTISNNLFINRYKRRNLELKFTNEVWNDKTFETPEYEMELREFDNKLQRAISSLSEKNRVVFLMNRIDNMTYVEIAEAVGVSVKAVEKRMKNALAHLRKYIEHKL